MITIKSLITSCSNNCKMIDAVDLSLTEETINGIVGLQGAVKTSFFDSIYELISSHNVKIKPSTKDISFLRQDAITSSHITGRAYLNAIKDDGLKFNIEQWNRLLFLPLDQMIDGYSASMKKKLIFLGVIKEDKPIVILDEPFENLDMESSNIIRSVILRLKKEGKTVIITSDSIETLNSICDYIHFIEDRQVKHTKEKGSFSPSETAFFVSDNSKAIPELTV